MPGREAAGSELTMSRALFLVLVIVACRAPAPDVAPKSNRAEATIGDANRELARGRELDYESPMRSRSALQHRIRAFELYRESCLGGARSACMRATISKWSPQWKDLKSRLAEFCRSGDDVACRWHTWDTLGLKEFPRTLSIEELHRGCESWLLEECALLAKRATSVAELRFATETSCLVNTYQCEVAAESYLRDEPRDPRRAQYLLELSCQLPDEDACLRLVSGYRDGTFAESVFGRAAELHHYVCETRRRYADCSGGTDERCVAENQAFLANHHCE